MKISLEPRNPQGIPAYWAGDRRRLATCTSVRLISSDTLVCASLVGQAMYMVNYDLNSKKYKILNRIDTMAKGVPVCTDLLAFDGTDLLATSNCEDSSVSFYRLAANHISFESELRIQGEHRGFCHGVEFVPDSDLVSVAVQSGGRSVQLWSRTTGEFVARYASPHGWPKDTAFVNSHSMLVLFSQSASADKEKDKGGSRISLIEFSDDYQSHTLRGEWSQSESQFDAIVYADGNVFVSDQIHDQITCFRLSEQLTRTHSFGGYSFPHGVDFDSARSLLAVSNYGDNSVELRTVNLKRD